MKLREYENRFSDHNILGAVLDLKNLGYNTKALKMYSGEQVWLIDESTYPSGKIIIEDIPVNDLLDSEVIKFINRPSPLMEGDYVMFTDGHKEKVTRVKEGNASPYPIVTEKSQYKWNEISMVIKKDKL